MVYLLLFKLIFMWLIIKEYNITFNKLTIVYFYHVVFENFYLTCNIFCISTWNLWNQFLACFRWANDLKLWIIIKVNENSE